MLLPCSAVPYSGGVRSSMTVISGDGVNILIFSPFVCFYSV